MPLSEKKKITNDRYIKNTFDEIKVRVKKGGKELIQFHAQTQNESTNEFINRAIDETIEKDNAETSN